jgi:hypothetical protein
MRSGFVYRFLDRASLIRPEVAVDPEGSSVKPFALPPPVAARITEPAARALYLQVELNAGLLLLS